MLRTIVHPLPLCMWMTTFKSLTCMSCYSKTFDTLGNLSLRGSLAKMGSQIYQ